MKDGYNIGRDWLVNKATQVSRWNGMWWRADVEWNEEDLLQSGKKGSSYACLLILWLIIDDMLIGVNHGIEQDGRVAILTVHRL